MPTIDYAQMTNIYAYDYPIPEIDIACFENITLNASLNVIQDPSYCHKVVLDNIDISANVFKKLFFDTQDGSITYNTFTNSYVDYIFRLLPTPNPYINPGYTIDGKTYYYYDNSSNVLPSLSSYISILPPMRSMYMTEETFSLQDELLDNIIEDVRSINPIYATLINTCSLIDFNDEVTNLKTLNDIIPQNLSLDHCALHWNSILEMVRAEYDEDDDAVDCSGNPVESGNNINSSPKLAILMITLVFKTNVNLEMSDCTHFISTTEVKLRYRVDFNELAEFQTMGIITQ